MKKKEKKPKYTSVAGFTSRGSVAVTVQASWSTVVTWNHMAVSTSLSSMDGLANMAFLASLSCRGLAFCGTSSWRGIWVAHTVQRAYNMRHLLRPQLMRGGTAGHV